MDWKCTCSDCKEKRANQLRHLEHPFYKKVDEVTKEIATEQILKGSEKYPNPFSPDDWTNLELVRHQLQELRDAQVYSVGLLDRLEKQEKEIEGYKKIINARSKTVGEWVEKYNGAVDKITEAKKENEALKASLEYWRAIANGS